MGKLSLNLIFYENASNFSFSSFRDLGFIAFIDFSSVSWAIHFLFFLSDYNLTWLLKICILSFVSSVLSIAVYILLFYLLLIKFFPNLLFYLIFNNFLTNLNNLISANFILFRTFWVGNHVRFHTIMLVLTWLIFIFITYHIFKIFLACPT